MGTRNLTIVKLGSKIHGQYGQWDGCPSRNGVKILRFLQDQFDEPVFKAKFEAAKFLEGDEVEKAYNKIRDEQIATSKVDDCNNPFDHIGRAKLASLVVERRLTYHFTGCEMGAGILAYIQKTEKLEIFNEIAFAANSLFCEWAYMVDLDERKLRVFRGFNKSQLEDGQFFKDVLPVTLVLFGGSGEQSSKYHPIREIGSLTFDEVATISEKDFLKKFNPREED